MKYCIPFMRNSKFKYYDEVDEISIIYNPSDSTLPDFLEEYCKNHTIVIEIHQSIDEKDIKLFKALYEKYQHIKFCFFLEDNFAEMDMFRKNNIPFFCNNLIETWEELIGFLSIDVTDVFITNSLAFDLEKVRNIVNTFNVQIRVIPNVAQSRWAGTPDIRKFWIRPEDMELYAEYVDVVCFMAPYEQLNTYYEIYAKDGEWFGDLSEIILNLDSSIDSRCIAKPFGKIRINCGQRCFRGGYCTLCPTIDKLANTMAEKNLMFEEEE